MLAVHGVAAADANFSFKVDAKKVCTATPDGTGATKTDSLTVDVDVDKTLTLDAVGWSAGDKTGTLDLQDAAPKTTVRTAKIDSAKLPTGDVTFTVSMKGEKKPITCGAAVRAVADKPEPAKDDCKTEDGKDKPKKAPSTKLDRAARAWFTSDQGVGALDRLKRTPGVKDDTEFLVHLPSGQPMFPFPSHLREGTPIQVLVVVPDDDSMSLSVSLSGCAALGSFRVLEASSGPSDGKQGAEGALGGEPKFALVPVGQWFQCGAGDLSYTLKSAGPDDADAAELATINVSIRAVYDFAVLTTAGFATTLLRGYELDTTHGGRTISPAHDRVGLVALVGAQWMIGRVDYADMRWYNHILNPFVAIDLTSPRSGFVVGDSFTYGGGVSVSLGLSVHQGSRLKNGAQVGDTVGDNGDVPQEGSWRDPTYGFFFGLSVDSKVVEALKGGK